MKSNLKLSLLLIVVSFSGLFAQRNIPPPPPAQGPYECEETTDFNGGIATSFIKPILESIIQEQIDTINNDKEKEVDYKIRWKLSEKTKVHSPSTQVTKHRDRSNQKYVLMPFLVQLEAYDIGPLNFERIISFTVNLKLFCRDWQHGNGVVKMDVDLTEPIISGGTIAESILNFFSSGNLTSFIDNKIQEKLKINNSFGDFPFGNPNCDCFDINKFSNTPPAWEISWGKKTYSVRKQGLKAFRNVKIDFQEIIRHKGLRTPANLEEDVAFDIWVNGKCFEYPARHQNKIVMKEEDKRSINNFSVKVPIEDRVETLQVIVVAKGRKAGTNGNRSQVTSGWSDFTKASKYGQGNRFVQTKKENIIPPDRFNPKPSSMWVKDYEIKFKVEYFDNSVAVTPDKVVAPVETKPPTKKPFQKQQKAKRPQLKVDN